MIDLKGMQRLADKAFRKYGMHSISVFEIQGLGNFPREGKGRLIMNHIHGVSWASDPFDHRSAMGELNSNTAWRNAFGADPVNIQVIKDTDEDLEYMGYYLFKPPYDVKMIESRKDGRRLKSTEKGYRSEFAVRILEVLSAIDLRSIVRATSGGSPLRKDWQRRVTYWHRSRAQWMPVSSGQERLSEFWDRYRTKKRRKKYMPYEIKR